MLSIFLISRVTYHSNLRELPAISDAVAMISLSIPPLVIFGILYGLAVANKRRTYYHMRYMIGTGILMIGPGVGRVLGVYFGIPPKPGVSITLATVAAVGLLLLVLDVRNKRSPVPNMVVTGLMILHFVLWELRYMPIWQKPGEIFAGIFF